MIDDTAATLARGQKAAEGINAIDVAVHELEDLREELDAVLKQIDNHKEDRGYWFSSLSNFFRLLGAFFAGSLATAKRRIAKDFTKKAKNLRRNIGTIEADADAAKSILTDFRREIDHALNEYAEFKASSKSDGQAPDSQ
jgi:uncharacterized coiled-coil DUF342 family protein